MTTERKMMKRVRQIAETVQQFSAEAEHKSRQEIESLAAVYGLGSILRELQQITFSLYESGQPKHVALAGMTIALTALLEKYCDKETGNA